MAARESIQNDSYLPKYAQLVQIVRRKIISGVLKPGDKITPERELVAQLKVSPSVVRQAMLELETLNLIVRQQGRGTFVTDGKKVNPLRASPCIGFIFFRNKTCSRTYFSEILRGVELEAVSRGIGVLYHAVDCGSRLKDRIMARLHSLEKRGTTELLVTGWITEAISALLVDQGMHFVSVGAVKNRKREKLPFATISNDDAGGAVRAVDYLLDLGHRRIAFVGLSKHQEHVREQREAFRATLGRHGIPPEGRYVFEAIHTFEEGYNVVAPAIIALEEKPTALFVADDELAIGIMKRLKEAGLRIPRDISVIGSGDLGPARFADPPLTTIAAHSEEMGRIALAKLVQYGKNPRQAPEHIVLPMDLVIRGSTIGTE